MKCPKCTEPLDAQAFLDACLVSWPNQSWVLFVCPLCDAEAHLQVGNYRVETGFLDGAPAPCFIVTGELAMPGLSVEKKASGLKLVLGDYSRLIPAKG